MLEAYHFRAGYGNPTAPLPGTLNYSTPVYFTLIISRPYCKYEAVDPDLVRQCIAIVGMHPDEATEAIVDAALDAKVIHATLYTYTSCDYFFGDFFFFSRFFLTISHVSSTLRCLLR